MSNSDSITTFKASSRLKLLSLLIRFLKDPNKFQASGTSITLGVIKNTDCFLFCLANKAKFPNNSDADCLYKSKIDNIVCVNYLQEGVEVFWTFAEEDGQIKIKNNGEAETVFFRKAQPKKSPKEINALTQRALDQIQSEINRKKVA